MSGIFLSGSYLLDGPEKISTGLFFLYIFLSIALNQNGRTGGGTFHGEMDRYRESQGFLWCYVCFVLLRFRLYAFVEAAALRLIVLRCAGAPILKRVFFFFPFVYLKMLLFPSIFCTISAFSLYGEYVVRSCLPNGIFQPRDHGLVLTSAYVRI